MHKRKLNEEKEMNLKETVKKWLAMDPGTIPKPKNNQEKMIQGLISKAKSGDSKAFLTLNGITGEGTEGGTPTNIEIHVVDNTRLEKFLYMTDEQYKQWKIDHEGMTEYKITCQNEEARRKLDEELEDEKKIKTNGELIDTKQKKVARIEVEVQIDE